ncbi:SNF1-related protein kinase regulatory subunit gamma-like PV42a [Cardamine amara subsp. amara]|uniref:SNF1-related protein kinase regulatory subunit gamma-like PV42a n=1 Tax=Cardamine amara subsp. amara TaxID=228776 RepID=A0ABD1A9S3_CARAN
MQQEKSKEDHSRLINVTAKDLTARNRRLVEVPYTATLSHAMNTLVANSISALPVAAPPGHWIGAGGSMIMESDKQTGAVRKHYIGILTMLDILAHIAGGDLSNLDRKMSSLHPSSSARLSPPPPAVSSTIHNISQLHTRSRTLNITLSQSTRESNSRLIYAKDRKPTASGFLTPLSHA